MNTIFNIEAIGYEGGAYSISNVRPLSML